MTLNKETLETLIYEEILRYLGSLDQNEAPRVVSRGTDILFLLSTSDYGQDIETSCIPSIAKKFNCALVPSSHCKGSLPEPFSTMDKIEILDKNFSPLKIIEKVKVLILFQPSLSLMASTALGTSENPECRILTQALLTGKKVLGVRQEEISKNHSLNDNFSLNHIMEGVRTSGEAREKASRIDSSLQSLNRQYAHTLKDWGVQWEIPEKLFPILESILEKPSASIDNTTNKRNNPGKRIIITADDIYEKINSGKTQWIIPANAIITDIARENAQRSGFKLVIKPDN
jgi:hypothetical protein